MVAIRPKLPNPPTSSQIKHATPSNLQSILDNANPGDHVQLAAGTYTGSYKFAKSNPTNNPVVIEGPPVISGSHPTAILSGQCTASGIGYWLHHLTFSYSGSGDQVDVPGSYINITRCWFRDNGTRITANDGNGLTFPKLGGGHHCNINYNRFTLRGRHNMIRIPLPGGNPGLKDDNHPHDTVFYRNYFWISSGGQGDDHMFYAGDAHLQSRGDLGCMNLDFEENFIDRSDMSRCFYVKRACRMIRNRFRDVHGNVGFRHGHHGVMWGNRIESGNIIMNGWNNDLRNNIFSGSAKTQFDAGGCRPPPKTPGVLQACDDMLLVHNQGDLNFGYLGNHNLQPPFKTDVQPDDVAGGKIKGVHVWGHTGAIHIDSKGVESGGVTNHGSAAYAGDMSDPRMATIPAGWDGSKTGFETTSADQGKAT